MTSNGVFESGKANVDKNSEDFKRLKRITSLMNNYFNKIGSTPKIKTVGYTDGEHINSSLGNERANRNLGTQRARNISSALELNSDTASKVSSNMYDLPPEKRACDRRRVTTIEFEAVPLIKQGTEGSYTPSFKMIKNHEYVKSYAIFGYFIQTVFA